jgi:hypothetical protein
MFEPNQETLIMKNFFKEMPKGVYLKYSDIEEKTGILMDFRGKSIMRSALNSLKISYRSDRGNGIELESADNCMSIVAGRVKKIDNSLKRADKTTTQIANRYLEELPKPDRERLLLTASLFGAIRATAKGLSGIYKTKCQIGNAICKPIEYTLLKK